MFISKMMKRPSLTSNRSAAFITILITALLLSACGSGAKVEDPIIVVATQPPADAGFKTFTHSSGVFSLRMPPTWIAEDLPDQNGARVQFTVPENGAAVTRLSVYIVNTGQPMTPEAFAQAVAAYQPPADLANYGWQEISRMDEPDLSHRIVGIRHYPMLGPRSLNIFLQRSGSFFCALEVDITNADSAMLDTLLAVVNTFRVNPEAQLAVGTVEQASAGVTSYSGVMGFHGYHAWTDGSGTFHITGEVQNNTNEPLGAVRLSAVLYDSLSRRLEEQSDILSIDVLGPGQSAPFDLRFEQGRPASMVRYELNVAGRESVTMQGAFYGPENFDVANEEAIYNDQNNLVVRGDLANIGSSAARSVKVIVAIWDDQARVIGAETVFLPKDRLVPQEASPFEVTFYDLGGSAVTFTLTIVGVVDETAGQ